jgi:hypothetical protein
MTAVPRLQLLPAPGTSPGTTAVALPDQREQRVQPVVPAKAARHGRPEYQQTTIDERQARQQLGSERAESQRRTNDRRAGEDRRQAGTTPVRSEAAGGRLSFSRLSSMPFMVQVLGQQATAGRRHAPDQPQRPPRRRPAGQRHLPQSRRRAGDPARRRDLRASGRLNFGQPSLS